MLRISKQKCLLATTILVMSSSALSKEISYNYLQGTFSSITDSSLPSQDVDANDYKASGSFSISRNMALTAGFGVTDFDRVQGIDIEATAITFGITGHTSVASRTDIYGNFSILLEDIKVSDGFTTLKDDDTGNVISFGLRHMASDTVELELIFSRVDVFDDATNTFGLGARFYANDKLSIGVGYSTADDVDALILNARIDI